jgi:putative ABC transport system permease protein
VPLLEVFRSAFSAIRAQALRSLLSMLGIAIGTAAVIIVGALGSGARSIVEQEVLRLGANLIVVNAASTRQGGARLGAGTAPWLTEGDLEAIRGEVEGLQAATAFVNTQEQVIAAGHNWRPYVQGVAGDWFEVLEWDIARGRPIDPDEFRRGDIVAVLGTTVARKLFGDHDPIGQTVRIRTTPFRVVGVAAEKGGERDDLVFVPLDAGRRRVLGFTMKPGAVMALFLKFKREEDIASGVAQAAAILRERRRLTEHQEDDFTIGNLTETAHAKGEATRTMALLLATLAGVSLIVGGIGIMNIMLVSVTERRREIGIRVAIGARPVDIQAQFLTEAAALGIVGGAVGVAAGIGAGYWLTTLVEWPMILSFEIVALSAGVAVLTSLVSGWWPAYRAARLDSVAALSQS